MVLSMSTDRTILWDQIRFVGAASEFAWILPVKPGATVEVASDAWIDTLDAVTSPRIVSAFPACVEEFSSCSTSGSRAASAGCGDAGFEGVAPPPDVAPPVDIVSRESVGPYEIVILRTDSDESLRDWLDEHEFAIPADLDPIIDDYIDEGFDFAAMRLVPAAGVTQMRPVRVVQPGAVPVLPLRMVVGGAGAFTPISLMVVTEGRYHPANFPFAEVSPLSVLLDPDDPARQQPVGRLPREQGGALPALDQPDEHAPRHLSGVAGLVRRHQLELRDLRGGLREPRLHQRRDLLDGVRRHPPLARERRAARRGSV
jgi:hypothetical protein